MLYYYTEQNNVLICFDYKTFMKLLFFFSYKNNIQNYEHFYGRWISGRLVYKENKIENRSLTTQRGFCGMWLNREIPLKR